MRVWDAKRTFEKLEYITYTTHIDIIYNKIEIIIIFIKFVIIIK